MSSVILPMLGSAALFVLYLGLAAILVRKYKATGDAGYLWLVIALVGWPLLANYIGSELTLHYLRTHPSKPNTAAILNPKDKFLHLYDLLQRVIGILLVIFAVYFLGKTENEKPSAT